MQAKFISIAAAVGALSLAQASAADRLDPTKTADSLTISRKIGCSTVDGEAATYWWFGEAYSRRQGEADKHLFNVQGMNTRACVSTADGYNLVSRELLIYTDKETGEPLVTWTNPWTGKSVDVLHVANDPVNGRFRTVGRDGKPFRWSGTISGDSWWQTTTVPLYYPNPLASAYQAEIGGVYHATEMFNFFGETDSLLDPATTTGSNITVGWVRMSDWLPWMMMEGRDGVIYFHTAGRKLSAWDELPAVLKNEVSTHYPEYRSPPPLDDARPNITSWKYYDQVKKGEVVAPVRTQPKPAAKPKK